MACPMQKKPLPFLDLPAEIRNQIYREVLISSRKFTVSRHASFSISNTGLLCASKQIHSESSCFFYEDNIFWFSQHLFHGDPVIEMLQNVFALPSARLMTLKKLVIDIPIYSVRYIRLRSKVTQNVEMLSIFIATHNGPGLKISIDLGFGDREDDTPIIPLQYMSVISPLSELREKIIKEKGELEIIVRTPVSYFGYWLHFLPISFGHNWVLVSEWHSDREHMRELCAMTNFQLQYGVPGHGNHFVVDTDTHSYTFSLRRDAPSTYPPTESLNNGVF